MKKEKRTDQNLEPNLEEDYLILKGWAVNIYPKFKSQILELEDLHQTLCEYYLQALVSYDKKPRTMPKRPFVLNNIRFVLKRLYRGQFKFEHRDITVVDEVFDPEQDHYEDEELSSEKNPFLFECSYDLDRALQKYSVEDRIIIYYKWFMNYPVKIIHNFTPSKKKVTYLQIKNLREKLRKDQDLIKLLKEKR